MSIYRDHAPLASSGGTCWLVACARIAACAPFEFVTMPSLIRLLMVLGLLGGAAYGAMFALANFVEPKQREMSITIPQQRLTKPN
jgi:hypothetical protein